MATVLTTHSRLLRRWGLAYGLLYLGYLVVGFTLRWGGWQGVDHTWYVDTARLLLAGSWRIYDVHPDILRSFAPPDGPPGYNYTPLFALLIAPFVGLADALANSLLAASVGGTDQLAYRLMVVPLLLGDLLAVVQFRRLARTWQPIVQEGALFAGTALLLLGVSFLQVSAYYEHPEGWIFLFLLLALQWTPRRLLLGGVFAGLALAMKQTALLELLPIGVVLLIGGLLRVAVPLGGARRSPPWASITWTGMAVGTFGAFMFRPFLANPDAVFYTFLTVEQRRVISGSGLTRWLDDLATAALGRYTDAWFAVHRPLVFYSNYALIGTVLIVVIGVVWWHYRRGRPVTLTDSRLLALVALGGLLQIVLPKWVGPHYYILPLALLLLWDTVRQAPRPPVLGWGAGLGFWGLTLVTGWPIQPMPGEALLFLFFVGLTALTLSGAVRQNAANDLVP